MSDQSYLQKHTNPPVFIVSAIMAVAFVLWGVIAPENLGGVADSIKSFVANYFGWWYTLSVTGMVIFVVWIMFSPYGRIKLGKDDEEPEWETWGWFSMLFTAGMGIGLVFYGVAEPIFHFTAPPTGEPRTPQAAIEAMNFTFFHWGLHPWAVYIVIGLSMAYFCFRKDLPLRPASALYPLIGDGIYGWVGNLVDIIAVFGTLFGLATSLGLGATQINAGLTEVFGVPEGATAQVLIIVAVSAVAVASVMFGIDAGIRRLSVINMYLAIVFAVIVFLVGPTLFTLKFMVQSTGYYIQHLPETSMRLFTFSKEGSQWLSDWTLFYWGWWIAWSPFVGMFIARISRGRTVRQFIIGCLLAPTGASIVWFTIFGGSALYDILEQGNTVLPDAGTTDAMFLLLQQLPLTGGIITLLSLLAIVVVAIFFATSSDSGSLVVDMLTNGGDPNPIWQQRLFWAVLEGVIAAVLLVAGAVGGGDPLTALQTASITIGLPFSLVLVAMCVSLVKQFGEEDIPPSKATQRRMARRAAGQQPVPGAEPSAQQ